MKKTIMVLRAMLRAIFNPGLVGAGAAGVLGAGACVLALGATTVGQTGCTKQQAVAIANGIVNIGVDVCQEAPQLLPPGSASNLVSLICPYVDNNAQTIQVLIDNVIWNAMKAAFLKTHGSLPKGMSPVTVSITSPSTVSSTPVLR